MPIKSFVIKISVFGCLGCCSSITIVGYALDPNGRYINRFSQEILGQKFRGLVDFNSKGTEEHEA